MGLTQEHSMAAPVRHPPSPVFDHIAFPIGLGFVAGFIDIFGFMAWYGLLAAHVTGNLIFLAVDIARGQYQLVMKLLALPIFAVSVAVSAWFIATLKQYGRHPFVPSILLQAASIGACLVAGLVLPMPGGPDDPTVVIVGSIGLFAMAVQNTTMRMILNNLPPTTVMTGNITYVVSEAVHWSVVSTASEPADEAELLTRRAKLIAATLGAFTTGAVAGGLAEVHIGYVALLAPIAVLLALLSFGYSVLRAAVEGSRC